MSWNINEETGEIDTDNGTLSLRVVDGETGGDPTDWDAVENVLHLVWAAPDLLAALKGLTQIGTTPDGGIVIGPQGWAAVAPAIAKARCTQ